jgi:hypothetical protein
MNNLKYQVPAIYWLIFAEIILENHDYSAYYTAVQSLRW